MTSWLERLTRRAFIERAARASVVAPLAVPLLDGCKSEAPPSPPSSGEAPASAPAAASAPVEKADPMAVPLSLPEDWDPVAFNTERGKAGAIPDSYIDDVTGPDGVKKHLGKHLPYQPDDLPPDRVPEGYLALMWGDPEQGYAMHPNAPPTEDNPEGHWYDWVRVAIGGDASSEVETRFDGWPESSGEVNGRLTGLESPDPAENGGRNTVYLVELPKEAKPGDTLRIWAHCLTHGEYVDFIELRA